MASLNYIPNLRFSISDNSRKSYTLICFGAICRTSLKFNIGVGFFT